MKMQQHNLLFTPPEHVHFLAQKLYGNAVISDCSIAYLEQDGGGPMQNHTHAHDHLFIVTDGEAEIKLADKSVILRKNESYLVKGMIPHSVWNHAEQTTVMIGISIMPA